MSNRVLKIQLWNKDPRCHWCERVTVLTNVKFLRGPVNPLMATIDHLVSRYHPARWVKKKSKSPRKVLACYECNSRRSIQETLCLSRAEILKRSHGFSLSPHGKPKIIKTVKTKTEALKKLNSLDTFDNHAA